MTEMTDIDIALIAKLAVVLGYESGNRLYQDTFRQMIIKSALAVGHSDQEAIEGFETAIAALPVIRQKIAERGLEFRSGTHG